MYVVVTRHVCVLHNVHVNNIVWRQRSVWANGRRTPRERERRTPESVINRYGKKRIACEGPSK